MGRSRKVQLAAHHCPQGFLVLSVNGGFSTGWSPDAMKLHDRTAESIIEEWRHLAENVGASFTEFHLGMKNTKKAKTEKGDTQ